jgi:hypothetical protein
MASKINPAILGVGLECPFLLTLDNLLFLSSQAFKLADLQPARSETIAIMGAIGSTLALCFGICRITCYNVSKALFGASQELPKPAYNLLCLGIKGSGKSTLLTHLAGEDVRAIKPTQGTKELGFLLFRVSVSNLP